MLELLEPEEPEPEPQVRESTSVPLVLELAEPEVSEAEKPAAGETDAKVEAEAALQPTKSRRRSITEMASGHMGRGRSNSHLDALVGVDKGGRSDAEINVWLEDILPLWESDEQLRQSKVRPWTAASLLTPTENVGRANALRRCVPVERRRCTRW